MLRVPNIKLSINEDENKLKYKIISKLKIKENDLLDYKIFRKSVDAREKHIIYFVYTVDVKVRDEVKVLKTFKNKDIKKSPDMSYEKPAIGSEKLNHFPVIIGTGPSGLCAGLILSQYGYKPILLERGEDVDSRSRKINDFWNKGSLDVESNVQFGEGGAGTFSDGKLTTLIKDKRCRKVLEEFVKAGAPKEILYLKKPHVGTDILKKVVKTIREEIIKNGGQIRFNSKVTDFEVKDNEIKSVIINNKEKLSCSAVLMGIGHSARDTFEILNKKGLEISQKAFSIGVRIEHPQDLINKVQYGKFAGNPKLGAADYKLSYHSKNRSAYTFCMCPGGFVIGASSENNGLVVNGMSYYKRDGKNSNTALLVGVSPQDFGSDAPLAGINFQRKWERLAYETAGSNYYAPVQLVGDFLNDRMSTGFGKVKPTYKPGTVFVKLNSFLPDYVVQTMKEAIIHFDKKLKGFAMEDAILTGVETRSSSPIRINRDEDFMSSIKGLYPIGEGAGYAGGIMSSAVDGIKAAEKIIKKYKN